MLIITSEDGEILAFNAYISEEESAELLKLDGHYWIEGLTDLPVYSGELKEYERVKSYFKDGVVTHEVYQEIPEPPTPDELYRAANLLNQAEIIANQRQQDKVMAAILLEQVGGEANV